MSAKQSKDETEQSATPKNRETTPRPEAGGLMLIGQVVSRRRRVVAAKKPGESNRYVIVLRVEGAGESKQAEMWSDTALPINLPQVGEKVALKVEVRAYVQGGFARHSLTFGAGEKGESF